jgi:protein involved in polysaccharide export with SLBB domain
MKSSSFCHLWALAISPLFFWSLAQSQDESNSLTGAYSNTARSQIFSNTSSLASSESDLNPYVGDFPLVDSLYKIGPGDLFQISYEASSVEKQVDPEGNIILNQIGVIPLNGLTLKEAEKSILDHLQSSYKRNRCFVNLRRPKTIRIFVTGAVNSPGTYTIPGNFRLSDGLAVAGNYSIFAQRGDIQIQSGDSVQIVDVRKFLLNGDIQFNPYLSQGCIIRVPFIDYGKPWVTVVRDSGSFIIQMEPNETAQDVMIRSYSTSLPEPYGALLVREKNGKDTLLSPSEAANYRPMSQARVEILSFKDGIFVAGAVSRPGYLPYRSDHKIIQYVSEAGLQTSSKISQELEVIHKNGQRENLPLQATLQPGDVVYIDVNAEQRFLLYTPILLSVVSLTLALLTLRGL